MKLTLLLTLLFSFKLLAQGPCEEEKGRYCSGKTVPSELLLCLSQHLNSLSEVCKEDLQRLAKTLKQTTPPGGGPLGILGGMSGLGAAVPMLSYEGKVVPTDSGNRTGTNENQFRFSRPVYKNAQHTLTSSASFSEYHFQRSVVLNSGRNIPMNLYRTDIGLQYTKRFEGMKVYGVQGSVGYSGEGFNEQTQTYSVSGNYSYPGKNGYWVLFMLVSNNGPFGANVPVPGVFYIKRTETFTGVFGLPILSMQWTPVPPWSFSFSALGPMISSEAAYGDINELQFFLGGGWTQQRFILTERERPRDRLTIEEKRIETGVRKPFGKKLYAEFKAGRTVDRSVYIGEKIFEKRVGEHKLDPGLFISWSAKFLFD